jgi:hypothetical protein
MKSVSKFSSYALIAMLLISTLLMVAPVHGATTTLELVNPIDGTHDFNFTTAMKNVGDTFEVDIKVFNIENLSTWQVAVAWDPTLLEFADAILPTGHVFDGQPYYQLGPDTSTPGLVIWSLVLDISKPTARPFTGAEGICGKLVLRIIKGVSMLEPSVECPIEFIHYPPYTPSDTFLIGYNGVYAYDIQFTPVMGYYKYSWVVPAKKPRFYILPSTIKPEKIGDPVDIEIWVADVDPNWQVIAFQFSIMWNTTCLAPRDPYWSRGTFMEAFSYVTPPEDGVIYMADINQHIRFPPLHEIPADYNYSILAVILWPDPATNFTYHPPFPNGGGKVAKLHFTAICETISPTEYWSTISFIEEDMLVLNVYGQDIGYSRADPAQYRCPMKVLGLKIDLYTQYDYPYGGQGENMPSDMFAPQQQVELLALVEYNEYPVQQKLVAFEIRHGDYVFWREATTDSDGIAHISFRIPWPCTNPKEEIFGKWYVIATVEVAEEKKNDTLGFWVWWPVEVLSIEPKKTEFIQRKTGGDPLEFIVTYRTFSMQKIPALITATIYDELGFFIGSDKTNVTVGWNEYKYYNYTACEEPPPLEYTWNVTIPMPTNAVVGKGTAFADAFDKFPWDGGTPYCPEVRNTIDFYIKKP